MPALTIGSTPSLRLFYFTLTFPVFLRCWPSLCLPSSGLVMAFPMTTAVWHGCAFEGCSGPSWERAAETWQGQGHFPSSSCSFSLCHGAETHREREREREYISLSAGLLNMRFSQRLFWKHLYLCSSCSSSRAWDGSISMAEWILLAAEYSCAVVPRGAAPLKSQQTVGAAVDWVYSRRRMIPPYTSPFLYIYDICQQLHSKRF